MEFAELSLPGVEFHLNADPIWTLREMIEADILIMARGWYSYYAGLISDGIKLFLPGTISLTNRRYLPSWAWMYVFPDPDWIPSPPGTFDRPAFERRLDVLLQARGRERSGS